MVRRICTANEPDLCNAARSYVITLQQLVIATYIILFLTGLESLLVFTITDWHRRKIRCRVAMFLDGASRTTHELSLRSAQPEAGPIPWSCHVFAGTRSATTRSGGAGRS